MTLLERIVVDPNIFGGKPVIPIAEPKFIKARQTGNRSLRFPREHGEPNGRAAWFPSRSGGNLKGGGFHAL